MKVKQIERMANVKSVPPEIYTKKFFLAECGRLEELLGGGIPQRLLYAFTLADIKKGMHVLDVGAGRGELEIKCAEAGAYVKAIDYSQAAIEIAEEGLKRANNEVAKRVVFEKMDAKRISYPDKSFDVVFMIDVVEHLYPEESRQVFLEIKRVLKPGGRVIIRTAPNAWLIKPLYLLAGTFFRWWEKHGMHVNEQSFFSLRRNLRLFGGKIRVFFRPEEEFFSGAFFDLKKAPSWAIRLAGLLDKLLENRVISLLIYRTPLVFFLGTNLWAIVEAPKEAGN